LKYILLKEIEIEMKKLITLLTLLISSNVTANDIIGNDYEWTLNNTNNWAHIKSDNGLTMAEELKKALKGEVAEPDYQFILAATILEDGYVHVAQLLIPSFGCRGKVGKTEDMKPLDINGKMVKMETSCINEYTSITYPKTNAGRKYLIGELKQKNFITFNSWKYSARGFTRVFNTIVKSDKAI